MINALFPITEHWSWGTYFLYIFVAVVVTQCCKKGAQNVNFYNKYGISKINYKFNAKVYYFLAFLVLVVLGTVRSSEVGTDSAVYIEWFQEAEAVNYDWSGLFSFRQREPGFQLYLLAIRSISSNYTVLFFMTSLIVSGAYIYFIKHFYDEKSNYTILQVFIYFYVCNMSGMRSALGAAFLLISFVSLSEEKYIKSFLLTLLAGSFHYTMMYNFCIILVVWVSKIKFLERSRRIWCIGAIGVAVGAFLGSYTLRSLLSGTKYKSYFVDVSELSIFGSWFYITFEIMILIYFHKLCKQYQDNTKRKNLFFIALGFIVSYPVIYILMAYRVPNYYALPRLAVWSDISNIVESRLANKRFYRIMLQIIICLFLLFRFTRSAADGNFVYHLKI